jgi:hypothetical protein
MRVLARFRARERRGLAIRGYRAGLSDLYGRMRGWKNGACEENWLVMNQLKGIKSETGSLASICFTVGGVFFFATRAEVIQSYIDKFI